MSKNRFTRLTELVQQCEAAVILQAADLCDGHTILNPQAFIKAGLSAEVVEYQTRKYKSDGSPKGTIFVNGQAVAELAGVYGLDMLRFLASALGVDYPSALGRGLEARNIQAAIRQHLSPKPNPVRSTDV